MKPAISRLNRFTVLPVLLDFLERKKLVLLDPNRWDDKNDTEVILAYKKKMGLKKLFVLCFTHDYETIHHWKTFANGSSGCCLELDANRLIEIFDRAKLKHGIVKYKTIKEAKSNSLAVDQMPFIKRKPYECEQEYRVIWEGETKENVFELDVPLDTIKRITISQQMPEQIFQTIKSLLKKTFKDPHSKVSRSTIYENQKWINRFKES